jgi:hypothetical protein
MSKNLRTIWTAIYNVLTVPFTGWEMLTIASVMLVAWALFRAVPILAGWHHIPPALSYTVLAVLWLSIGIVVPIVMRRKKRK